MTFKDGLNLNVLPEKIDEDEGEDLDSDDCSVTDINSDSSETEDLSYLEEEGYEKTYDITTIPSVSENSGDIADKLVTFFGDSNVE